MEMKKSLSFRQRVKKGIYHFDIIGYYENKPDIIRLGYVICNIYNQKTFCSFFGCYADELDKCLDLFARIALKHSRKIAEIED